MLQTDSKAKPLICKFVPLLLQSYSSSKHSQIKVGLQSQLCREKVDAETAWILLSAIWYSTMSLLLKGINIVENIYIYSGR